MWVKHPLNSERRYEDDIRNHQDMAKSKIKSNIKNQESGVVNIYDA
jgi:hypothetical protein